MATRYDEDTKRQIEFERNVKTSLDKDGELQSTQHIEEE